MINVIPKVKYINENDGYITISDSDFVSCDRKCKKSGEYLMDYVGLSGGENGKIKLSIDESIANAQGYEINIDENNINIKGASEAGVFYGVQTLRQLLPPYLENSNISGDISLKCLTIKDNPQFEYRGFMLDSARHFFDKKAIKKILDLMALHKLNKFHWHLTDDQGFRVEVEKYPKLTEIGSVRKRTRTKGLLLPFGREYEEKEYSGYYSKEDIREIVEYAKEIYIDVIPEIDMPGHMSAAFAAYPEYCCKGTAPEIPGEAGIYKDVLCVGNDKAIEFAISILLEIGEMFPYKHLHIGGDEVPLASWKKCEKCQKKMKQLGLRKERELQHYFSNKIASALIQKGYTVIGWDGVLNDDLDTEVINQYWLPFAKKKTAKYLNSGTRTIFSPSPCMYLDYTFTQETLRRTYEYNPFDLTDKEHGNNILGVEAPLWTEFVRDEKRLEWQTFPKLTAVSEVGWTASCDRNFESFLERLESFEKRLDVLGINYAPKEVYMYDRNPKMLISMFGMDHKANIVYKKYHKDQVRL